MPVNPACAFLARFAILILPCFAGACKPAPEPAIIGAKEAETRAQGLTLPAVWQSADLGASIAGLAIAGVQVVVAYEDGGLQLLDFEGDRITDRADLGVRHIADGRDLTLNGQAVTVFPAIGMDGAIALYLQGGGPGAPVPYGLNTGPHGPAAGLCSAPPLPGSDGLLRLGFWAQADQRTLHVGRIVEMADALIFLPDQPVVAAMDITACLLTETGAVIHDRPTIAAARLQSGAGGQTLLLDSDGGLTRLLPNQRSEPLTIRNGLTVRAPRAPMAMAATMDARAGGYPGGLIVIAGPGADGAHAVTYIDPSRITRP